MKKLLTLMLVLAMASVASASLLISVDGVVDPEDTSITLQESQHAVIDVHSFGEIATVAGMIFVEGDGALSFDNAWIIDLDMGSEFIVDISDDTEAQGYLQSFGFNPVSIGYFELVDSQVPAQIIPDGKIVDLIDFHCTGINDAIITLWDAGLEEVRDQQVIHQPEPMTIALLGLGGLFLRRRK